MYLYFFFKQSLCLKLSQKQYSLSSNILSQWNMRYMRYSFPCSTLSSPEIIYTYKSIFHQYLVTVLYTSMGETDIQHEIKMKVCSMCKVSMQHAELIYIYIFKACTFIKLHAIDLMGRIVFEQMSQKEFSHFSPKYYMQNS